MNGNGEIINTLIGELLSGVDGAMTAFLTNPDENWIKWKKKTDFFRRYL